LSAKTNKNPALNKDGVFIWDNEYCRNPHQADGSNKITPQTFRQRKSLVP